MPFKIAPVSRRPIVLPLDQIRIDRLNTLIESKRPKHGSNPYVWLALLQQTGIEEEHSNSLLELFTDAGWETITDPRDNVLELVIKT